jgi:hypothetical protein
MFRYTNGNIVNEKGKVLEVHGSHDVENRQVIAWKKHNGISQQWDIVYVDEQKPEPKKGQYNQDFGFYVMRPFYIQSQTAGARFLTLMGSNVVISAQTGEANQKFYFDQTTKTIKTAAQANRSLDIASNGGSTNLQVGVTSNVWW